MKIVLSFLFFSSLFLFSCNDSVKQNQETNNNSLSNLFEKSKSTTESPSEEEVVEITEDCDEFIDKYEAWMNEYVELLSEYMKNPTDADLNEQFVKQGEKASFWISEWNGKLVNCTNNEKYQKRFDEISEKLDEKIQKLGLQ